ncbi:MAG: ferrous iron transport protein A [Bacteroidota bacterium]|jgi:ferrous iron transport protein A
MILNKEMATTSKKLSQLRKGDKCIVDSYKDDSMQQKMLDMGCLPGEIITIDRFAPLGCPIAISVAGTMLCIRKDEADNIFVKLVD